MSEIKKEENKIVELNREVETYRKAIQDAKDALASAEAELDETLDMWYGEERKGGEIHD